MNESLKPVAAGVFVIIALVVLVGSLRPGCSSAERYATADAKTDQALVHRMARAVGEDQGKGEVVLVRYSGYTPATEKLQKIQVDAFDRALPGGYDVVELPPESLAQEAHGGWVLRTSNGDWGKDLLEWMGGNTNAVAVVSLVGVPKLRPEQWEQLPPFYAVVVDSNPYIDDVMAHGYIKGLAVMRQECDAIAVREFRGPKDELFEMVYEYVMPNASE